MKLTASFLKDKFEQALPYPQYVLTGTAEQQRRWAHVLDAASLTETQSRLVGSFQRDMHLLVSSGIWCGDCVQQVPLLYRIAEANPARIRLRILDRDQHRDLAELVRINGGDRVPVVLLLAEDFELCSIFGDRVLQRYRALASRQLGAACETGIAAPVADELHATLQGWLDEIERVQLMLRLSSRLRMLHND
jgi:thiol-disulfide isomerase/thioredoxin